MKWLTKALLTLREVGIITGTGLVIVWSQLLLWIVLERPPSDVLLAVGVGLLPVGAAKHARTVVGASGGIAGPSSPSQPQPSSLPSLPSVLPEGGTGGDPGRQGGA